MSKLAWGLLGFGLIGAACLLGIVAGVEPAGAVLFVLGILALVPTGLTPGGHSGE